MCSPTLAISAASNGLKFFQAQRESRNARNQARIQNERAKNNRILKLKLLDMRYSNKVLEE